MNHLKTNPVGIDKAIQQLQIRLYEHLEFDNGYGRVYKVEKDTNRFIPAHFVNETEDYIEVLTDDSLNGSFFFLENRKTIFKKDTVQIKTPVDIIFQMNLNKLRSDISHRADEEMRLEILNIISLFPNFEVNQTIKGIRALDGLFHQLRDMQPYHYLKVSGNIKYKNINC